MDLTALATFVAVAERRSFSRAAEAMFTTQPAVSKRIRALEEDLGVRLFDRLGREVRLTEAGAAFLNDARRILADLAASRDALRRLGDEVGGRLALGTSHHVGIHRLPPVLRRFVADHPKVELDLVFMDSEQAFEQVARGALELAVVTLPDATAASDPRLETAVVWPDPLAIVAARDHPLAVAAIGGPARSTARARRKPRPLLPSALGEHRAVLPGRGTVTRRILLEALAPHEVPVVTSLETNYLETIKMLVSVGLGWSALPTHMVDESIVALPVRGLQLERRLGSVLRRGRTPGRAAVAMLDALATARSSEIAEAQGRPPGD